MGRSGVIEQLKAWLNARADFWALEAKAWEHKSEVDLLLCRCRAATYADVLREILKLEAEDERKRNSSRAEAETPAQA